MTSDNSFTECGAAEQLPGLIERCATINETLEKAHIIAAQIIGPLRTTDEVEGGPDCCVNRLEEALVQSGLSAQGLVEQLSNIARRF